jgi:hypothetical protein
MSFENMIKNDRLTTKIISKYILNHFKNLIK